ncbi:hypothetical protein C8R44DRAFT_733230 [Mycena epipterygia]|nr:hypothetical protein C8R44DRAFT_733230 [Mycena epipterygia]
MAKTGNRRPQKDREDTAEGKRDTMDEALGMQGVQDGRGGEIKDAYDDCAGAEWGGGRGAAGNRDVSHTMQGMQDRCTAQGLVVRRSARRQAQIRTGAGAQTGMLNSIRKAGNTGAEAGAEARQRHDIQCPPQCHAKMRAGSSMGTRKQRDLYRVQQMARKTMGGRKEGDDTKRQAAKMHMRMETAT